MGRFSQLETHESVEPEKIEPVEDQPTQETSERAQLAQGGADQATYVGCMRQADEFFYAGEWKKAMRLYSRALSIENTHVEPWSGQVLALLLMDQAQEADVWSRRAIDCFPDHPVTVSLRGLTYVMQGMVKRGLASSDFAMGQGQTDALCWVARGWMLLEAGNANWEACFQKIEEMAPCDAWRYLFLKGLILERYKKWPQAAEAYKNAVEDQMSSSFLWRRLGVCYGKLGLKRKALEAREHARSLDPNDREANEEINRHSRSFTPVMWIKRLVRGRKTDI